MNRFSKLAAILTAVPVLVISGSAAAGSPGQLAGGNNYLAKNLTQNGSYADTTSATCNDEVQYSMQLSNTQFGALNNVTLKATLPSNGGLSTATATTDLGGASGTSDTTTVNLGANQTQSLENGTTTLYDGNGHAIKTLPDTITNGVNIGTLNGSTTEYVNFRVKVNCPTPPAPVYRCDALNVTVGENRKVTGTVTPFATNGAVLANVNWNWADGNSENTGTTTTASHTYAKDNTYSIVSTLTFNVGDATQTAACTKSVTITTPPVTPPPTTPPATPTALPNTGPGSVVAIFAGASTLAGVGHYIFSRRNLFRG